MRISLQSKYSLALILLVGMIIVVLSITTLTIFKRSFNQLRVAVTEDLQVQLTAHVNSQSTTFITLLQEHLTNPLYEKDFNTIHKILHEIQSQPNVKEVVVFDTNCSIISSGKELLSRENTTSRYAAHCAGRPADSVVRTNLKSAVIVSQPIYKGKNRLGGVALTLSIDDIQSSFGATNQLFIQREQEGIQELQISLIVITIFVIIFALLSAVYIAGRLVKPIERLRVVARQIGRGNYDDMVKTDRNDELGDLTNSFDQMRIHLKHSTVSIERLEREIKDKNISERERGLIEEQLHKAQRLEAMGQLAAGVAHDLNNILSGIVTIPQLMLLDLEKNDPARISLLKIQEAGERAAGIVQDMLTLARSGMNLAEPLNLADVVRKYLDSSEHDELRKRHPDINFITSLDDQAGLIRGSTVQIFSILMNLINNSAEAIHGPGQIVIKLYSTYVDQTFNYYDTVIEGDYLCLCVKDNGEGMSEESLSHIFEPFYSNKQLGRSGTGLGMAIVWNAIKDHSGYVDITSQPGKGTSVYLYFPVATAQPVQESLPTAARKTDLTGNGRHILVVDDIQSQRDLACAILERLNYTTGAVESGQKVLPYLASHKTDMVLLDMVMDPGFDGLETCSRIFSKYPDMPVILVSGYAESEKVRASLKLGAKLYLKKPYTVESLGAAVKGVLSESEQVHTV